MVRNTYEVQSLGELLRDKRQSLQLDLQEVSTATKIRSEYLLALETGNYNKFVSSVYAKGFLKKYAKFLGISPERAVAMYRREQKGPAGIVLQPTNRLNLNTGIDSALKFSWGRLIGLVIVLLLIGFGVYLFTQVQTVFENPEINLTVPITADSQDTPAYTTIETTLQFRGSISPASDLLLNDQPQNTNQEGFFDIDGIQLQVGTNSFKFQAINQFGRSSELDLTVIRLEQQNNTSLEESSDDDSTKDEQLESGDNIVGRIANNSDSQIALQVSVDGTDRPSQLLAPNEILTLEANSELRITPESVPGLVLTLEGNNYQLSESETYLVQSTTQGFTVTTIP